MFINVLIFFLTVFFLIFKRYKINMGKPNGRRPIYVRTSMYVPVPFYLVEEQHITSESRVVYERVDGGLIIKVGGVK